MERLLQDKIALVTGGARGIGKAIVREFVEQGATVYFNYSKSGKEAQELVESLKKEGTAPAEAMLCNVCAPQSVKEMVADVRKKSGRIDILVNNAGITRDSFLLMMKEEDWDEVIKTNLYGAFYMTKAVSRVMIAQKSGCILNIASVAAIHGAPGQSNYSASKGGIIAFTKSLSMELIPKGIRVNCILPGFIETDMTYKIPSDLREKFTQQIPCGRMGKPEEIAQAASFLASNRAFYIIGQSIVIDGGLTHGAGG